MSQILGVARAVADEVLTVNGALGSLSSATQIMETSIASVREAITVNCDAVMRLNAASEDVGGRASSVGGMVQEQVAHIEEVSTVAVPLNEMALRLNELVRRFPVESQPTAPGNEASLRLAA